MSLLVPVLVASELVEFYKEKQEKEKLKKMF